MKNFLLHIKRENIVIKLIYFIFGVFLISMVYNTVFVPKNIVIGGVSGIAIIFKKLTGFDTTKFITISNIVLLIVSFIFLGKRDTFRHLLGSIVYPLMLSLTEPLAGNINLNIESDLLLLMISSIIYGIGSGIIYRAGYSTGGADIVIQIFSHKFKKSITHIAPIIQDTIIIFSGIVFSPIQIMYAVMIIFISNKITNYILYSISTKKMVYVISKKNDEIEDYIMNKINTGATEIKVHCGLFEKKKQMLFCIVHNAQYESFKHNILIMDPYAFILANNCYEVNGGQKYAILPF